VPAPWFVAARIDWSQRGGAALDVVGASAGVGVTLLDGSLGLAVIAQLRGDLRISDGSSDGTSDAMAPRRAGLSAAAGLEVALPSTPITAGLRYEQGLVELVDGARDRAVLVEVGVDWR
nr:hypothetical protein [Deltaproteobacteria bacterium]